MGRELRMVPKHWQHPRDEKGNYIPLLGDSYSERLAEWQEAFKRWHLGFKKDWINGGWEPKEPDDTGFYSDYIGECPEINQYMPEWPENLKTHFQMYENTSEGTPISPVMETPEKLARWLADTKASAFAGETASYEDWLATIRRGWAMSGIAINGNLTSGVAGQAILENK
mgnify:CR=1 FL=1